MYKKKLANQLRARQYRLGLTPSKVLYGKSDDDVIRDYLALGDIRLEEAKINELAKNARNSDHFL